jgi:hypothetical protein
MNLTQRGFHSQNVQARAVAPTIVGTILAALFYPFALSVFHWAVGTGGNIPTLPRTILAAFSLAAAFAVPAICMFCAVRLSSQPIVNSAEQKALRLSYLGVAAPTAYTFMGVLWYMIGSPVADQWVWVGAWLVLAAWALAPPRSGVASFAAPSDPPASLRVAHGIAASVIVLYVAFHITNHLFGLFGADAHAAVMKLGRLVYRSQIGQPLLVALLLFQICSGLALAWRWSEQPASAFRVFQVASGVYLSLFILGHMNSVFFFARTFLKIDTDWNFAIGAPTGIIHDPWNIRLLPHYWLGVFFVLSHLASGLRVILSAHGMSNLLVVRIWAASLAANAVVASLILAAMCGLRLGG